MAEAKALFNRHWMEFCKIAAPSAPELINARAILYAACIIAETIRTDVYDEPFRVISPKDTQIEDVKV